MFASYGAESSLPPTEIQSVCHRSGTVITMRLEKGRIARSSAAEAVVCFTAPLREWYNDLVNT